MLWCFENEHIKSEGNQVPWAVLEVRGLYLWADS